MKIPIDKEGKDLKWAYFFMGLIIGATVGIFAYDLHGIAEIKKLNAVCRDLTGDINATYKQWMDCADCESFPFQCVNNRTVIYEVNDTWT